jgi:hypothetical protein
MSDEEWVTVEEFQKEANEGHCWVCMKNKRVAFAWHTNDQRFLFHAWSTNQFENVTHAIPLFHPAPPQGED